MATEPWVYFNPAVLKEHDVDPAVAEAELVRWLKQQAGVQAAYGRSQIGKLAQGDEVGEAVRRSFHPDRCGDVAVVLKPYYLMTTRLTGTSHGMPYPYDTHVPLLVFGSGVRVGVSKERISPLVTAAITARALCIEPLKEIDIPAKLFQERR